MRRLIVNADDLGANPQRSHGVFQAFEFGVVRNASILANGSDADRAAKHAREKNLPAGLHLNLTEGSSVCEARQVGSLLEANGSFFGPEKLRRAFDEGTVEKEHLEREVRAQVEWMFDAYGPPTHVDGHHTIHCHPAVVQVLLPILERYGIRFVRISYEPVPPFGWEIDKHWMAAIEAIGKEALAAKQLFDANGIGSTDHFRGLALHGYASAKNLRHALARLPEGTTELSVHPGSQTASGSSFDLDPQRQTELNMLTDPDLPALLAERKIELISWRDL